MENNITEKLGFTKHTTFRKFQGINKRGGVYMYIHKKMYLYMYVKVTFTRCEIVRRHLEHIRNRKRNAICFGFFLYIRLTKNMESQYYNFWSNSYDLWLNSKQNFFCFFYFTNNIIFHVHVHNMQVSLQYRVVPVTFFTHLNCYIGTS